MLGSQRFCHLGDLIAFYFSNHPIGLKEIQRKLLRLLGLAINCFSSSAALHSLFSWTYRIAAFLS